MIHALPFARRLRLIGITILGVLALAPAAFAQTVTLAWDANDEPDLEGYIVLYGQSGGSTTSLDVGNVTSRSFSGLQANTTYNFRVVAYNATGQESTPSSQVSYTVPSTPPPPPPAPTILSVSPGSGPTTGGTVITIAGANFVPNGTTVRVGNNAATVTSSTAFQVQATTPAGTSGPKSVLVTANGLTATLNNAFSYTSPPPPAAPTLSSISPTSGPTSGGTAITLTGSNFSSSASVTVGGNNATVTSRTATQIEATTPAGNAGARSVVVTSNGQTATLNNGFTYTSTTPPPPAAPTLSSVSPSSGPTTGGTAITLTGTNFASTATVTVGVNSATVTSRTATQILATTPAGTAGAKNVVVTQNGQTATRNNAFTYTATAPPPPAAPTLSNVTPASGPTTGGTTITLIGTNFLTGASVKVDGRPATVTLLVATQILATTPAGTAGAKTVEVTNTNGQSASRANAFTYATASSTDADGDGLPTAWEQQFGLNPNSASGNDGATGDPDADSATNQAEYQQNTHPRGSQRKYLAEGAVNSFFSTRFSIANPQTAEAKVLLTFSDSEGRTTRRFVTVPARSRRTVDADDVEELEGTSFATMLESDQVVVLDRLMTWASRDSYAAHTETALDRPATTWYFAEGATGGPFELFYLIQNPSATAAELQVRYLLPNGRQPIVKTYTVEPGARFTIWVDNEDRALAGTDVSAVLTSTNGVPVIVERSMYLNTWRRSFKGGHNSAGVTAPATRWFLAEGSTGEYLSMYVLFANPGNQAASVRATFLRNNGSPIVKTYSVPANSRYTVDVSAQDRALRDASVAVQVESTNNVPIIVERTMWWPNTGGGWTEGHNAFGTTTTGPRWLLAEGEVGGRRSIETFVLVANTSTAAANVKVTILYESGAEQSKTYTIVANRRYTVPVSADFPSANGKRFSVLVESLNPAAASALVVERAMYWNTDDEVWGAGSNAVGAKLP